MLIRESLRGAPRAAHRRKSPPEALRISGLEGDRSVSWPRSFTDEAMSCVQLQATRHI